MCWGSIALPVPQLTGEAIEAQRAQELTPILTVKATLQGEPQI